jgi:hypothetical protein
LLLLAFFSSLLLAMHSWWTKKPVRCSPYSVSTASGSAFGEQLVYKEPTGPPRFSVAKAGLQQADKIKMGKAATAEQKLALSNPGRRASSHDGWSSLKDLEDAVRMTVAKIWIEIALEIGQDSPVVETAPSPKEMHLLILFCNRSAGTLRRHLGGWRRWSSFAVTAGISIGAPALSQVLDFCHALHEGALQDRGQRRVQSAKYAVSAMRFVASRLQLTEFLALLDMEIIQAWVSHGKWSRQPTKEAKPLPLYVVVALEAALVRVALQLHGCFLLFFVLRERLFSVATWMSYV